MALALAIGPAHSVAVAVSSRVCWAVPADSAGLAYAVCGAHRPARAATRPRKQNLEACPLYGVVRFEHYRDWRSRGSNADVLGQLSPRQAGRGGLNNEDVVARLRVELAEDEQQLRRWRWWHQVPATLEEVGILPKGVREGGGHDIATGGGDLDRQVWHALVVGLRAIWPAEGQLAHLTQRTRMVAGGIIIVALACAVSPTEPCTVADTTGLYPRQCVTPPLQVAVFCARAAADGQHNQQGLGLAGDLDLHPWVG
mmetsp:Transcript_73307/g.129227  ORF Transcript_73307/g.129227 Transcript_73307/m.129227 type:complete len:255 (-) Transcript_73307:339-1103(-)